MLERHSTTPILVMEMSAGRAIAARE